MCWKKKKTTKEGNTKTKETQRKIKGKNIIKTNENQKKEK